MSSTTRESTRNGLVRRMASLPRSILGGFSSILGGHNRAIGGGSRNNDHTLLSNPEFQYPETGTEAWAFLTNFQTNYTTFSTLHPFFYACSFMEAMKIAEKEHKFLFMYLHSPEHPFTPSFCKETLCSELVVQFLDANFICWGALANRGEGLQMASMLRPGSYPFCAVIAPVPSDSMTILQQMEGPVSPAELVEILQRTVEEQGMAFEGSKAKKEEIIRADRRIREEQDAQYLAALHIDKEKEKLKNSPMKPVAVPNKENHQKLKQNPKSKWNSKVEEAKSITQTPYREVGDRDKDCQATTQILIRFPNGEKREQSFSCTDKMKSIYRYIDSLGIPGIGNYRLISNFPRRVYDADKTGMTLKEVGLYPRATLFLEHQ